MGAIAQKALAYAISKIGCRYSMDRRWEDDIFDCSSLIYRAFKAAGYIFKSGSTSNTEVNDTNFDLLWPESRGVLGKKFTSIAALKKQGYQPEPGDVIYINTPLGNNRANKIGHVVFAENEWSFVHARGSKFGVVRTGIDMYGEKIVAVTRFREGNATANIALPQLSVALCGGNDVKIRSAPNVDSKELGAVYKGHPLVIGQSAGNWVRVSTLTTGGDALCGWISKTYI